MELDDEDNWLVVLCEDTLEYVFEDEITILVDSPQEVVVLIVDIVLDVLEEVPAGVELLLVVVVIITVPFGRVVVVLTTTTMSLLLDTVVVEKVPDDAAVRNVDEVVEEVTKIVVPPYGVKEGSFRDKTAAMDAKTTPMTRSPLTTTEDTATCLLPPFFEIIMYSVRSLLRSCRSGICK